MWSPELYQKAVLFAARAHGGQLVPGTGVSYVVHLANVAQEIMLACCAGPPCDYDLALACALLHDTLEDTEISAEALEAQFGAAVVAGVRALTKDNRLPKEERMSDSLERIRQQPPEVWMVKLADRITNLQSPPPGWSREKRLAYRDQALEIWEKLGIAHPFLGQRLKLKIQEYLAYCLC